MDIERLAKKLAPLMPEQVRQWLRARRLASPELRDLIDKQIIAASERHLGNLVRTPLLSLPPQQNAKGEISLGTVLYDRPKWPMGVNRGELLQGMSIFGRSGSGKTNLVFHILTQLARKGIPFLFLDWKQTARHFLPLLQQRANVYTPGRSLSPLPFNLFAVPPGIDAAVYRTHLVDVISDAFTLGEGARSLIQRALTEIAQEQAIIQIEDVIKRIEGMPAQQRQAGWKVTALRALGSIKLSGLAPAIEITEGQIAQCFFGKSTVVELDSLGHSSRKMLVPLLCLWLYQAALVSGIREKLRLVIVLEEAHHYLYGEQNRSRESLLEMLLRQCREVGIAAIVADQHPHLISSAALGNSYATICLNLKDPADVSKAAAISGVPADEKTLFTKLPVGQGVLRLQDRWIEPAVLQIPHVDVQKGAVTDEILRRSLQKRGSGTGPIRRLVREIGRVRRIPGVDDSLDERGFALLEDVFVHPDDGVKERYRRLGIGGSTGHALKEVLVDRGWLEAEVVPVGTSRKVLVRVSRAARELLGIQDQHADRESLAHAYWKRFYAKQLQLQGYDVQIETPRNGGYADVVGSNGQQRIAIEVETGKSDIVDNVKSCLAAKFTDIIIVAVSASAMNTIESRLAAAGLLIPNRIAIIRAGAKIETIQPK